MAVMARKEMLTSTSCSAMGRPMRSTSPMRGASQRMSRRRKEKGIFCLRMMSSDSATLMPCAATVAIAAPAAAMRSTPTSSRSPAMLTTQAMATVISGMRELPSPRKMLPSTL